MSYRRSVDDLSDQAAQAAKVERPLCAAGGVEPRVAVRLELPT